MWIIQPGHLKKHYLESERLADRTNGHSQCCSAIFSKSGKGPQS